MILGEVTPLLTVNNLRETISCMDSVCSCWSSFNRRIVTTGVVCLSISGTVAVAAGVGYAFFEGMNPISYIAIGGGLFIGTINCLSAVCLCLNRSKADTAQDLKNQRENVKIDKNIQVNAIENKEEIVQILKSEQNNLERINTLIGTLKMSNDQPELRDAVEEQRRDSVQHEEFKKQYPEYFPQV